LTIRSKNLREILAGKYLENDQVTFIETKKLKDSSAEEEIFSRYEQLGGILDWPDMRIYGYYYESSKFVMELDEQMHFNKYRLLTLRSSIYDRMPGIKADKYRIYCKKHEKECMKSGASPDQWSHVTAEKYFGSSESPGDLGLRGSAGWKYRAFCDFVKDIYAFHFKVKLLRVAIWDEILINKQLIKIGELLLNPTEENKSHILKYLERRIINLYAE